MNIDIFLKEFEAALAGVIAKCDEELRSIRSNRPSVELIEHVLVRYYDQMTPVRELASLSIGASNEVQIQVWDKTALPAVMGALETANLGLSLSSDGTVIRGFLPALSSERRDELGKLAKKAAEGKRIEIRSRRDEAMKKVKAAEDAKEITEDDHFLLKEKIQKAVDGANEKIEILVEKKIKELGE